MLSNLRGALRRLFCRHERFQTVHLAQVNAFGSLIAGPRVHAAGFRLCLKCGAVRADSLTSSIPTGAPSHDR